MVNPPALTVAKTSFPRQRAVPARRRRRSFLPFREGTGAPLVLPLAAAEDLRVLAAKDRSQAGVLLVNYGLPAARDLVATGRFAGLAAACQQLTVWRIDGSRVWSARELELLPTEHRTVEVQSH